MARILIAEDEASVREFVNRALPQRGHEVTVTCDGSEALDALKDGTFDLPLAYIVMPQLGSVGLALKVAKNFPDLRILLMTGYAAERDRAHNLDASVHEVVNKPFSLSEICDTVDAALKAGPELH